jgi:porphobilinogen deaminase
MKPIRIALSKQHESLIPLIISQLTTLATDYSIEIFENPIEVLSQDKTDIVAMPLHECLFQYPAGIIITALSKRETASHLLAVRKSSYQEGTLLGVPENGKIAVGHSLLAKLLSSFFPTINISIRKGILEEWENTEFDALLLPEFYVPFLNTENFDLHALHPSEFTPAGGQGVLAWLCNEDDLTTRRILKNIHHSETAKLTNTERRLQKAWGNAFAYCEKDTFQYYHLYTLKMDENEDLFKEKQSSSSLATWVSLA